MIYEIFKIISNVFMIVIAMLLVLILVIKETAEDNFNESFQLVMKLCIPTMFFAAILGFCMWYINTYFKHYRELTLENTIFVIITYTMIVRMIKWTIQIIKSIIKGKIQLKYRKQLNDGTVDDFPTFVRKSKGIDRFIIYNLFPKLFFRIFERKYLIFLVGKDNGFDNDFADILPDLLLISKDKIDPSLHKRIKYNTEIRVINHFKDEFEKENRI